MPITILYVETGTSGGGSFESLYLHLKNIDRTRISPVVVFVNHTHYVDAVEDLGVPVYLLRSVQHTADVSRVIRWLAHKLGRLIEGISSSLFLKYLAFVEQRLRRRITSIVKEHGVQIVHLNTSISRDIVGLLAANKAGSRVISHLRGGPNNSYRKTTNRRLSRLTSGFVANSEATKRAWARLGVDEEKIVVVHNAVQSRTHLQMPAPDVARLGEGIGLPTTRPLIGCMAASIRPVKGLDVLINAFADVTVKHPGAKLAVMGGGRARSELETLTRDLGLTENVRFTGYLPNATSLFACFDLIVIPSRQEPFGRVAIEAMAAGTPVVATDVGGLPEIIEHGRTGLLVKPNDVAGLTKAINQVLENPEGAKVRAEHAEAHVLAKFSVDNYLMKMDQVYNETLNGRSSSDDSKSHRMAVLSSAW